MRLFIPCYCSFFQRGFVSGSGDSTVKFWEFELVSDAQHSQVRLEITYKQHNAFTCGVSFNKNSNTWKLT